MSNQIGVWLSLKTYSITYSMLTLGFTRKDETTYVEIRIGFEYALNLRKKSVPFVRWKNHLKIDSAETSNNLVENTFAAT